MSLLIRRAHAAELAETRRILAAAFEPQRPEPDTSNGAFTRYLDPPGQGHAATRGSAARPWPSAWAALRALGVDPAHRRRGIGRRLSEARVQRARELGAPVVALHTSRLFAAARHMIQALGWQRLPEYDYVPAPTVQAEAYVLRLSEGDGRSWIGPAPNHTSKLPNGCCRWPRNV